MSKHLEPMESGNPPRRNRKMVVEPAQTPATVGVEFDSMLTAHKRPLGVARTIALRELTLQVASDWNYRLQVLAELRGCPVEQLVWVYIERGMLADLEGMAAAKEAKSKRP